MDLSSAINLISTASGTISQKNVAIYEGVYSTGNSTLGADTNQILGGLRSDVKEVLNGGALSESLSALNGIVSFFISTAILSTNIKQQSEIFQHPLEMNIDKNTESYNSAKNYIADHSIIKPNVISIRMALPSMLYQTVYLEIERLWKSKSILTIVTRANTYKSMVLKSISHSEEPKTISRMVFDLQFQEIQATYPNEFSTSSKQDTKLGVTS